MDRREAMTKIITPEAKELIERLCTGVKIDGWRSVCNLDKDQIEIYCDKTRIVTIEHGLFDALDEGEVSVFLCVDDIPVIKYGVVLLPCHLNTINIPAIDDPIVVLT